MIHLIWSIINGIIVFYFLYLILGFIAEGKRIFNPQFKIISIFIMVIGIVHIINASHLDERTNRIIITNAYNTKNQSEIKSVTLEDNWTFDIKMSVKYAVEQNEYIPIESSSFLIGLISGHVWEFNSIQTHKYSKNESAAYTVNGVLHWNLFGINIYNESKTFSGFMD